jgi:putative transposase
MRKSRFSAEQISTALRQVESGAPVAEVTRKLGVSEKTYYLWKKQYAHLLTNELRELRQLREENAKLKRLVADLTLDKVMLQEVLTKRTNGGQQAGMGEAADCQVQPWRAKSMSAVGAESFNVSLRVSETR